MKKNFLGINLDLIDTNEAFVLIENYIEGQKTNTIFFLNAHCFNIACKSKDYQTAINKATLLLNDGIGIKLASILNRTKVKENMNGTDLIPKIIHLASVKNKNVFFLGSEESFVKQAATNINSKYDKPVVKAYHSGYFDKDKEMKIFDMIRENQTDILVVGMGVPKQELWIDSHLQDLKDVKLIIAGGAIIDFIAGKFPRAPKLIQKIGLEWFYRFLNEPRRLFKRYIIGNFTFFVRVLSIMIRNLFSGKQKTEK